MILTASQLDAIMPNAKARASTFLPFLNAAMAEFDINTPVRAAAFLAQVAHESGELRYVKELASGEAYEGRKDLGNTSPGDGVKYKGRGLIQLTGKTNYEHMAAAFGVDCVVHPELVELPENACRSAAWFWKTHGLNELADQGQFTLITKRINGGTNGIAARCAYWEAAKKALGA